MSRTLKKLNSKKRTTSNKRLRISKRKGGSFKPNQYDLSQSIERRIAEPLPLAQSEEDETSEEIVNEPLEPQIDVKNELEALKGEIETLKSQLALLKEESIQNQTTEHQSNHMFIGYSGKGPYHDESIPIIVKKNEFPNPIEGHPIFNIYEPVTPTIILPYLFSMKNIRGLDLRKLLRYYSLVDENHNVLLKPFFGTDEKYLEYTDTYRTEINDVMEKYPGLFLPIS